MRNGITPEDLEKEYQKGKRDGFNSASPEITKTLFAAVALAARSEFGFGWQRVKRLLEKANDNVLNTLDSVDAIDQVFDELGLTIDFKDPLEPIKEVETDG